MNKPPLNLFKGDQNLFLHVGPSMNPTLKTADVVEVEPCASAALKPGDIIVFRSPDDSKNISHRVIRIEGEKVFTRGDNNNKPDDYSIDSSKLIGRVVRAERGKKHLHIFGGAAGQIWALGLHLLRRMKLGLFFLLRPAYHLICELKLVRLKPQALIFKRFGGTEIQLCFGQRVIGRWHSHRNKWQIRPPFKLFINEQSLPRPSRIDA